MLADMNAPRPPIPHDGASLGDDDRMSIKTGLFRISISMPMRTRCLSISENQCSPRFRQPMGVQINIENMLGNGNIDRVGTHLWDYRTKISTGDTWMIVNHVRK